MMRFRHSERLVHEESSAFDFYSLLRHTERSEASKALSKGFTLPEVCVALSVLLIGTTALLGSWNFFNCEVADERRRLEHFEDVLSTMESLIANRPLCVDSVALSQMPMAVRLKRIPGNKHLAWAIVEREGFSLKRLVRCR